MIHRKLNFALKVWADTKTNSKNMNELKILLLLALIYCIVHQSSGHVSLKSYSFHSLNEIYDFFFFLCKFKVDKIDRKSLLLDIRTTGKWEFDREKKLFRIKLSESILSFIVSIHALLCFALLRFFLVLHRWWLLSAISLPFFITKMCIVICIYQKINLYWL